MYAIIETGGKQYRAEPQGLLQVESLEGDVGTIVEFDSVRFLQTDQTPIVGTPTIPSGPGKRRNCSACSHAIHYGFQNETPQGVSSNQGTPAGFHPSSDY